MKKKRYTRPVSVMIPDEMFNNIETITNLRGISIDVLIREVLEKNLTLNKMIDGGKNHEE